MEKDYPPADQYPPMEPTDGAYPPACPPNYQPPYPTDQYPPAPYPAAYPMQPQPPAYDPGAVQQQQATVNTVVIAAAPQPVANVVHAVKPNNYMAMSIINLLCCCWLLGIAGIIYSIKVDREFAAGRYEEARRASNTARNINFIGIGIGIFVYIIAVVVNVATASSNS